LPQKQPERNLETLLGYICIVAVASNGSALLILRNLPSPFPVSLRIGALAMVADALKTFWLNKFTPASEAS
jgi:hypothetical protein